jgi:hypothetical protein
MPRPTSPLTARGVELIRARIAAGLHPQMSEIADLLGVHRVTLIRACQRAGLALPQGRPRNQAAPESVALPQSGAAIPL